MPRGRPKFEPNEFQRGQVNAMVVCGIPTQEIARALGISKTILTKHYAEEIAVARTKAHVEMGSFIFNSAIGRGAPEKRLSDERARSTLAIFYAKTQMGWKETSVHEHRDLDRDPDAALHKIESRLARLAAVEAKSQASEDAESGTD